MSRSLGAIYTPQDVARFLTSWAIKNAKAKILDIGVGEGVFSFAAYNQLVSLGANPTTAQTQIYGSEIDGTVYNRFLTLAENTNINFPNLHNKDFFDLDFPPIDVVVGNPPYVRRTYIEKLDRIRQKVTTKDPIINELSLTRLTDLYIYFLLYAISALKPGGKIAVITADSWLNVGYGEGFKQYLQKHVQIEALITFDRPIFHDALVKPAIILAIKKRRIQANATTHFIRLKNGLPISSVKNILEQPGVNNSDITYSTVKSEELKVQEPWGVYFKIPDVFHEICSHPLMTKISNLAETRIGIQTLAKDFFVLAPEQAEARQIESEYLEPLAQSSKYFKAPVIQPDIPPIFYVFYCSRSKEKLQGTHALEYILRGEGAKVPVRGKNKEVIGYHNKERIQSDRRKFWYDLKSSIERRGRASILIPRLIYRNFTVVWNKAEFVPGELFIEFFPSSDCDLEVYLAVLNSSISEILLRAHAQVYGGGTYNIKPGKIKTVPILNVELLAEAQKDEIKQAYFQYLENELHDRTVIDKVIYEILGFNITMQRRLKDSLEDLLVIATSSRKRASTHP